MKNLESQTVYNEPLEVDPPMPPYGWPSDKEKTKSTSSEKRV